MLPDFHAVALVFSSGMANRYMGRVFLGLPKGFHGRQLGRLDLGHLPAVMWPWMTSAREKIRAKPGQAEGLGKKANVLLAQQMTGAIPITKKPARI